MAAPTPNTPILPAVRHIVGRVHRRCGGAGIADPRNVPLTAQENFDLARSGYYPIPPAVIRLGMTPAEHQRQQILDAIAEQLPDAIAAVLEAART